MKKINEKYFTIGVYSLIVFSVSLLFLLFCLNISTVFSFVGSTISALSSIFYGILLAFLLLPLVKRFDVLYQKLFNRKKEHPSLVTICAVVTSYLIALILLGVTIGFIIPALIKNIQEFSVYIKEVWKNLGAWADENESQFPFIKEYYGKITALFSGRVSESASLLSINLSFDSIVSIVTAVVSAIAEQTANIFMGLIISIYMLGARRILSGLCGKIVVALVPKKSVVKFVIFFKRLYTDFCTFASTRVLVVFFFSAVLFAFCWLLNIPMFSVLILILLLTHLVPAIGPLVGDAVAITLAFLLNPIKALFFALFLIGIEIVASKLVFPLLTPKKLRPSFGLTAVLVLVCGHFLGPIGAFCAVPLFATLNIEFREFLAHRLAKKNMPISIEAYEGVSLGALSDEMEAAEEKIAVAEDELDEKPEPSDDIQKDAKADGVATKENDIAPNAE